MLNVHDFVKVTDNRTETCELTLNSHSLCERSVLGLYLRIAL